MKRLGCLLLAVALVQAGRSEEERPEAVELKDGDTVVLIGDSITQQGASNPWGFYHLLTNAVPTLKFLPLGYGGYQVKTWIEQERKSVTNDVWTWYETPKLNVRSVLDGKVDALVVFLGMNDILQPSIRDSEADIAQWAADYRTLLANLRSRCHPRKIALATITPLTTDPASPKNVVRARLNDEIRQLAEAEGACVLEFGAAIEQGMKTLRRADPAYRLIPDFVHPNRIGHALMAREIAQGLLSGRGAMSVMSPYHVELANCVRNGMNYRKTAAPPPWKLSEDGGDWKVYSATDDYTGGKKPGSIDPFQCFFGWRTNTLRAARRVWSEKDRDVRAILSHQGFSETLDLTVALDGQEVWKDRLNRNGRNYVERKLHLHAGWNSVLVTCVHHDWQRQFSFDFEPIAGDNLSLLKYGLE